MKPAAAIAAVLALAGPVAFAAQAQTRPQVNRAFLAGRWSADAACTDSLEFLADGHFITSRGAVGAWRLEGNQIVLAAPEEVRLDVTAIDPDTMVTHGAQGGGGRATRCAAATRFGRPVDRAGLVGRWTGTNDCTNVVELRADGRYTRTGAAGAWRVERDQLVYSGAPETRRRAAMFDRDTLLLQDSDGTLARFTRC